MYTWTIPFAAGNAPARQDCRLLTVYFLFLLGKICHNRSLVDFLSMLSLAHFRAKYNIFLVNFKGNIIIIVIV